MAYGGTSKQDYTGVSTEDLRAFGAVSTDAVAAMARGLQQLAGVAWAVAESGIAGPQTSRRSVKPVGTVCLAIVGPAGTEPHTEEAHIDGDRAQVMVAVAEVVLARLRRAVELSPMPPPH